MAMIQSSTATAARTIFIATIFISSIVTISAFAQSQSMNQSMNKAGDSANQTGKAIQGNASDVGANISEGAKNLGSNITEGAKGLAKTIDEGLQDLKVIININQPYLFFINVNNFLYLISLLHLLFQQ